MSNETFEQLYKKFTGMINSFIKKYRGLLENDEIHQCCCLAIMKAYNTYNNHKDMKLSNWIYQNMEWQILRELSKENKHKNIISVNSTIESSEGDTIELIDLIADDLDLQEEIQNKLMINYYESECRRVLPEEKFQVCYLKWFKGCSNAYIAEVTHRKYIHDVLLNSRSLILAKSRTLKEEYHKLHNIDDYSHTERLALLDS